MLPRFYGTTGSSQPLMSLFIKRQALWCAGNRQPCTQDYDQHDIDFLTGFANILAERSARPSAMLSSERVR